MKDKTTIFLHIAKTGGTTLHSILSWQYLGYPSYWTPRSDHWGETLRDLSERRLRRLKLLRGHFVYGAHEKLPDPSSATYVTLVRHPLGHVRSQYGYYQKDPSEKEKRLTTWDTSDVAEILSDEDSPWLDNVHVRRLAGIPANCKNPVVSCQRKHYEQAMENLEDNFSVIGITNQFDESVILMGKKLGWRRPLFYRSANVQHRSDPRDEISQRLQDLILEKNRWDFEIYKWARKRLKRHLSKEFRPKKLEKEKKKLKRFSSVVRPVLDVWRSTKAKIRRI